jgi:transposase-like protein
MQEEKMLCPKCAEKAIKYGKVLGKQRWQCKSCKFQFTGQKPKGKPLQIKLLAVFLYLSGMSFNAIAYLFKVSDVAVLKWVRQFAKDNERNIKPKEIQILELDEMWHYVGAKKTNYGYGQLMIGLQENLLPSSVVIGVKGRSKGSLKS